MESKRFGGGLLGGLIVGLVIVLIGTAATGPSLGLFGSSSLAKNQAPGTSDVVTTYTTTVGATARQLSNGSTNPIQGSVNTTTIVTTVTTVVPASNDLEFGSLATSLARASPSRLNNIAAQPLLADGVVLVPVLIALLAGAVGAVLYRASVSQKQKERVGKEVS